MTNKALCIGINNYPGTESDLTGCVNDANDWRNCLAQYGFEVIQLLDAQATKDAMRHQMEKLVREARDGDVIVLTYSGHGSWIPDTNGDEPDGRDEVFCPYDLKQNGPIIDDDIYQIFEILETGVHALFIADSCHSGGVSRVPRAIITRRARYLPPETFLAEDELTSARNIAATNFRRNRAPRRQSGVLLFAAAQDYEYSWDTEFNGRPNGAFTRFAINALNVLSNAASYAEWLQRVRQNLPDTRWPQTPDLFGSTAQKSWRVFGNARRAVRPCSINEDSTMSSHKNLVTDSLRSPWQWGRIQQQRRGGGSRPTTTASSILDGTYVTATGGSNTLFVVQNGRRQLIDPNNIRTMNIVQDDIQELDPLDLRAIPLDDTRRRAIGRDLQTYLWSDLRSGHFMQSWVWLQGTALTVRTITETVTWFGGYSGGVSIVLFDTNGSRILHDTIRYRYGIDGRVFGSGRREDTETVQLPQNVADAAESILILHYWDPKVDLVAAVIDIAQFIWDAIRIFLEAQQRGEPVNAGGEPF